MKPRKGLSVYVLLVGVLGLLIVAGVFSFQLIDEATKSQIPASQRELVKPIDGIIEQRSVDNLQTRRIISKDEVNILPTPTLALSPTPETIRPFATTSAEVATTSAQKQDDTN